MIYRTICTQLWTDKKVQRLTVHGKLLFVYLITNPHTHLSGIYYLPKELITKETGLSNALSDTLFNTLSAPEMDLAYYDAENSIVFVINMFRYQGRGEKNERSAAVHNSSLHYSPLVAMFLERYPRVKQYCPQAFLDRVSDTVLGASKRFPSVPVPDPVLLTNSSLRKEESEEKTNGRDYRAESKLVLAFLNEKTGKKFREVDVTLDLITARLKSGIDVQTCKTLIARKVRDWTPKPEMQPYLRPETLFNKTKFETYLAEVTT